MMKVMYGDTTMTKMFSETFDHDQYLKTLKAIKTKPKKK